MAARRIFTLDRRVLDADARKLEAKLTRIKASAVPKAQAQALNRTAQRTQTRVIRSLAKRKQVAQKVIRSRVKVFKAKPVRGKLSAMVWIGTKKHIPIESLPGARVMLTGKHAGSLRAGRITVKPFRATMPSGHTGLYVRKPVTSRRTRGRPATSSPNLPIEHPVIRLMPDAQELIERHARVQWRRFYPREITRLMTRALQRHSA